MRSVILLLGFLAFALGVHAAQQTFVATPQSLAGWTLLGADAPALSGQAELTLPANAQLVRSFTASEIALQIVTRPVIGEGSSDWPVLELGSAALVFSRHGATGRLFLVIADEPAEELPLVFSLDEAGRSAEILTIGFTRNHAVVSVAVAGQILEFSTGAAAVSPTWEIVASAGGAEPWSFQQLVVMVSSADPVALPTASVVALAPDTVRATATDPLSTPPAKPMTPAEWIAANRAADKVRDPRAPLPVVTAATCTTMEIFTPPPVRRGRIQVVRAAVQARSSH